MNTNATQNGEGTGAGQISPLRRYAFVAAGMTMVGIGVIGIFLPLLPTTIFMILAAGCFARSSPRLERYLLDHPRFGWSIRAWRENGAIARRGKLAASAGIAVGMLVFTMTPAPAITWLPTGLVLALVVVWIWRRPEPGEPPIPR